MTVPDNRPNRASGSIRKLACEAILDAVLSWNAGTGNSVDRDDVLDDLIDNCDEDAYQFAKNLDDSGWSSSRELVEILDNYSPDRFERSETKKWVEANKIVIPFKVGDLVAVPRHKKATIVDLRPDTAHIVVQPLDEPDRFKGEKDGYVIACELAVPITGTIGELAGAA